MDEFESLSHTDLRYRGGARLQHPVFPSIDPRAGTLASLATYSVGFDARPIGGAIFGHFGDRIGRKITLMITLVIMALVTFAVERGRIRRGPERNHCVSLGGRSL